MWPVLLSVWGTVSRCLSGAKSPVLMSTSNFVLSAVAKQGQGMPMRVCNRFIGIYCSCFMQEEWKPKIYAQSMVSPASHCVAAVTLLLAAVSPVAIFCLPSCLSEPYFTPNCCSHPSVRWCLSNLPRCFLWSLGHSLSFDILDAPWLVCAVGPAGSRHPLLSCSAVQLSNSCGSSALWIHLPWGCRTGLICSCLWCWSSGEGIGRKAGEGFFPFLCFPCRILTWNNIYVLPRKYWLQSI